MNAIGRMFVCGALGLSLATVAIASAAQDAGVSVSVSKSYKVQRGSAEYQAIRRFIASATASRKNAFGAPEAVASDSLGDSFSVSLAYSSNMLSSQSVPVPGPNPPWIPNDPTPSGGDAASVHTCSAKTGLDQTWYFTYESNGAGGGEWVLQRYVGARVKSCAPGV